MCTFSIHTYELTRNFTKKEASTFIDLIYADAIKENYKVFPSDNHLIVIDKFNNQGIRIVFKQTGFMAKLKFIVSPMSLLDNEDLHSVITSELFEKSLRLTDELLTSYLGKDFSINRLKLTRVDLCTDIRLNSREELAEYIRLLYKMQTKQGYKIVARYIEQEYTDESFKCENASAGVSVSVYDKEAQLNYIQQHKQAEQVKNVLRFEFQLKSRAIARYTRKGTSNTSKLWYFMDNSVEVTADLMSRFIYDGDFYALESAKEIVRREVASKKLRKYMLNLLDLTSEKKTAIRAIRLLRKREQISISTIVRIEKEFQQAGLNIVTLNPNSSLEYLQGIKNLLFSD